MPHIRTQTGGNLHYTEFNLRGEWDTDPGDPVILIHGLGCDWRIWRRQIGWLAHTRRVVAPDVRGSGRSSWPAGTWTTADLAADIHDLAVALGLRRPALAGISMGGTIAMQYAADYPGDVSRLVVLDSFAGIPAEFAAARDAQLDYIQTHTLRQIAEERMAVAFTRAADPRLKAWVIEVIAGGDIDAYRAQAHATLNFDLTARLAAITAATTVLHGSDDQTVPSAAADVICQGIPASELHLIPGQGHFANLEAPALLNPLLARALGLPGDLVPAR